MIWGQWRNGRRVALRTQWGNPWGFKSLLPHRNSPTVLGESEPMSHQEGQTTTIEKIFHYTSFESALKIIESCALKTTNPKDFNDPFECWPRIKRMGEYTQDELESLINQHRGAETDFIKMGHRLWRELHPSQSFLEFCKERLCEGLKEMHKKFPEFLGNHLRLISCSSKPNAIPMWAHYADEHTGVVLEF